MKWENIPMEEQETIMNIDYYEKTITIYTSRKSVSERLERKIGEPYKVNTNGEKITSVEYKGKLSDKKINKYFSKMLLVGTFREKDVEKS